MSLQEDLESATQLHRDGKLLEAQVIYRQVLQEQPAQADALRLLGVSTFQLGNRLGALELLQKAVAANPSSPESHCDLGLVLTELRRVPEAITCYRVALSLRPDFSEALYNLGIGLYSLGKLDEAAAAFFLALEKRPDDPETLVNLGNVLQAMGHYSEAANAFQKALQLRPGSTEAYNNLGNVLQMMGEFDRALGAYRDALDLRPDNFQSQNNLGQCYKAVGRINDAVACFDRVIALQPQISAALSNRIFALHLVQDDPQVLRRETAEWDKRFGQPLKGFWHAHTNEADANRKLKVGYISPNFRNHLVTRNLMPLWRHHDREQFEIFFYSDAVRPDEVTQKLRELPADWREIAGQSDDAVSQMILRDKIDLLIDPSLHTPGNRLPVFARKPAPVQIAFGAYPGSSALAAMDFRLTDMHLDPPGNDAFYSEQSIRLPESYWCYDENGMEWADMPDVGPLPSAALKQITFGCLNNFSKVTDVALKLWSRVLDAAPQSRLLLMAPRGSARQRVLDVLGDRVGFVEPQPRREYFQTYQRIDIALDTFPYNGHISTLDALWMGVPVITLVGKMALARAGFSQLSNLGLTELAAKDESQFVEIAAALAGDAPRLRRLRWTLRPKMRASPLTDAKKFARNIESAYRAAWKQWCAKSK